MTLVELMVAMVILGVGLLGMAGLSLRVNTQFRAAARQADAALLVQSRIDSLASTKCANIAASGSQSGTTTTRGVTEKWILADGNDIKTLVDSVTFTGRKRPLVYTSVFPCRD